MAIKQNSVVTIENRVILLDELREFVEATENWAAETIVSVDATAAGQVKIEAKFGDILR